MPFRDQSTDEKIQKFQNDKIYSLEYGKQY